MSETSKRFRDKAFLRNVIGEHMVELGKKNDKVVVVNADLMGTCRNKSFVEAFPERSFNVGIAEQNMISFAAGLGHEGFIPYTFTMAPFMSMRACEQVRTDVAYAGLPVKMISVYAGFSGGISGATHWGLEDCAIVGSMGGMTVVEVSDPYQAVSMLDTTVDFKTPLYIRSGVEPVKTVYDENYKFELGKASIARDGDDGAIICSGVVVQYAVAASDYLKEKYGLNVRVVDMHTLKPIDRDAVIEAAKTGCVIVAQDHNIVGGLGYSVASVLAEEGISTKFKILGAPDHFIPMAHATYLYHKFGYDAEGLRDNMLKLLNICPPPHKVFCCNTSKCFGDKTQLPARRAA